MITLEGNYREGGGAIVRTALALSMLTHKPFVVRNIRAGRVKSGLKAQHVAIINALCEMSGAQAKGAELGSHTLEFIPGQIKPGRYEFSIGTAGSIGLFLQGVILPCLFARGKVTLTVQGGTCGLGQAGVDYIQNVLFAHLRRFAQTLELKIIKRGYYPKGGGKVEVSVRPKHAFKTGEIDGFLEEIALLFAPFRLDRQGELEQVRGVVNLCDELSEREVGERIANASVARTRESNLGAPCSMRVDYASTSSLGGEVCAWALCSREDDASSENRVVLGSSVLLEKGRGSEGIGRDVIAQLEEELRSGACVDVHLADQLIMYFGLLPRSVMRVRFVSEHTRSNIYVTEKFLDVVFREVNNELLCLRRV